MEKVKNKGKKVVRVIIHIMAVALFFFQSNLVYAKEDKKEAASGGIQGSKLATGTEKLLQDATAWLLVLAPVAAILCIIYFCIRRGMADEMDQKKWNNRIVVTVVSCIGAVLGSTILNVVLGYYK